MARFLQVYFLGDSAMVPRDDYYSDLNMDLLTTLRNLQATHNVLLGSLKRVYDEVIAENQDSANEIIRDIVLTIATPGQHLDRRTHNVPSTVEVAAFVPDFNYDNDHVHIRLFPRRGGVRYINHLHRDYDSICYPLFFIYGNPGFEERIPLNNHVHPRIRMNSTIHEESETDSDNENDNPRHRARSGTHNNNSRFSNINYMAQSNMPRRSQSTRRNRVRRITIRDLPPVASSSLEENDVLLDGDLHHPEINNGGQRRSRGRQQYQSASQHYAYRLMVRNSENNIILRGRKLFQQFLCDIYIKVESIRMLFYRNNQDKLRYLICFIRNAFYLFVICNVHINLCIY